MTDEDGIAQTLETLEDRPDNEDVRVRLGDLRALLARVKDLESMQQEKSFDNGVVKGLNDAAEKIKLLIITLGDEASAQMAIEIIEALRKKANH